MKTFRSILESLNATIELGLILILMGIVSLTVEAGPDLTLGQLVNVSIYFTIPYTIIQAVTCLWYFDIHHNKMFTSKVEELGFHKLKGREIET